MELRHLRYFCAVGQEEHVTRAAAKLRVAQSALTKQLRSLEQELQVKLLRKSGRGIALTEAGSAFFADASEILDQVQRAIIRARETEQGLLGAVTIGLADTAGFATAVTRFLEQARKRWPNVTFKLREGRSVELFDWLIEKKLDMAFVRAPARYPNLLEATPFLVEPYVAAMPLSHPLAGCVTVGLDALSEQPLILPGGRCNDSDPNGEIVAALRCGGGREPNFVQRTPGYVTAINLVAAGFGVTIAPSVLKGLRSEAVRYRPLATDDLVTTLLFMRRLGYHRQLDDDLHQLAMQIATSDATT